MDSLTPKSVPFSKSITQMGKGVFILLLLVHHLFYEKTPEIQNVDMLIKNRELYQYIIIYCKLCVGGFAFISAYGITKKLMQVKQEKKEFLGVMVERLIKFYFAFWFAYILAALYKTFVIGESLKQVYITEYGFFRPVYFLNDFFGFANYFFTPTLNMTWWYATFAILLIITLPLFYQLYKRYGVFFLLAATFLPQILLVNYSDYSSLIPTIVWGIAFAQGNLFEKMSQYKAEKKHSIYLKALVCIGVLFATLKYTSNMQSVNFIYPICAILFLYICYEFFSRVKVLEKTLCFVGNHAGNIFFIHTFIYYYFYSDFIYCFKKDYLIFLVLLGTSVGVSILMEIIKKISGYLFLEKKLLQFTKKQFSKVNSELE